MEGWLLGADSTFTILLDPSCQELWTLLDGFPVLHSVTMESLDALCLDTFCECHRFLVLLLAEWIDLRNDIEFQILILSDSLPVDVKIDTLVAICERFETNLNRLLQFDLFLWSCHACLYFILVIYSRKKGKWILQRVCEGWAFRMLIYRFCIVIMPLKACAKIWKSSHIWETNQKQKSFYYIFLRVGWARIGKIKKSLIRLILSTLFVTSFLILSNQFWRTKIFFTSCSSLFIAI